ncbi:unknown [Gryllus bimaculatus nudivirus]|uniref:Uncharacterized protein n=1 Tax=Gryllus bimaculatus nudivirus TaxID=432587 RepID=A4L260_9VIRU|nr:hypothetical protein GrBNV_gp97 [Gryllus bimaculatus nudivirus]ABO45430.1 unknown [Gryllus bimaculatus nudivirus]
MNIQIFDESIFNDGEIFKEYIKNVTSVGVSNRADAFLINRLGLKAESICSVSSFGVSLGVNPNKKDKCPDINVFTVKNKYNYTIRTVLSFQPVVVSNSLINITPVVLDEYINLLENINNDPILTINKNLTEIEHVIMIKFYAVNRRIFITPQLYLILKKYIDDFPFVVPDNLIFHTYKNEF